MDTSNDAITPGSRLLLTYKGQEVGVMDVESRWAPNKAVEAQQCYGSTSLEHPAVHMVATERGRYYLGGKVTGFELPKRWVGWRGGVGLRAGDRQAGRGGGMECGRVACD
jgi:sulfate adenylyltransferase